MKFSIFNFQFSIIRGKILFILLFIALGFIFLQIPVNVLEGSRVKFTLFDLFAPISGAFLGSVIGVVAVLIIQVTNLLIHGLGGVQTDSALKLIATLRFLPLIVGVWYFSLKANKFGRLILLVPLLSIVTFISHPIGKTVWFYSLFWLIPILAWPVRNRFLLVRSLGSTFTAHAAGGAVWIWAFNLPANVWVSLIPVVIMERVIFALGISASFILMNNVLAYLKSKKIFKVFFVDKKHLLPIKGE